MTKFGVVSLHNNLVMDLQTWPQIHTKVFINFEMASPKTLQFLKKLLFFVTLVKSCHIATILKTTNFKKIRNEENFESLYGLGGHHLKIREVCMDLEPCSKVHNLVVIQL